MNDDNSDEEDGGDTLRLVLPLLLANVTAAAAAAAPVAAVGVLCCDCNVIVNQMFAVRFLRAISAADYSFTTMIDKAAYFIAVSEGTQRATRYVLMDAMV
jgi:hypothetical protein